MRITDHERCSLTLLRYTAMWSLWGYAANMTWMITIPDSWRESLQMISLRFCFVWCHITVATYCCGIVCNHLILSNLPICRFSCIFREFSPSVSFHHAHNSPDQFSYFFFLHSDFFLCSNKEVLDLICVCWQWPQQRHKDIPVFFEIPYLKKLFIQFY